MKYKFVVLEGIDACGKTFQVTKIADFIYNYNRFNRVLITREPTGSQFGREARRILKNGNYDEDKEKILDLFIRDRNWHIENVINPFLLHGGYVICDRYFLSTLAYQSLQEFSIGYIREKQGAIRIPDITFLLDVDVDTALKRLELDRKTNLEIFERKDFMKKCREKYLELMDSYPNIVRIDANRNKEDVTREILEYLV